MNEKKTEYICEYNDKNVEIIMMVSYICSKMPRLAFDGGRMIMALTGCTRKEAAEALVGLLKGKAADNSVERIKAGIEKMLADTEKEDGSGIADELLGSKGGDWK